MSAAPLVAARGLSKTFRRGPESVHALVDVSLELAPGEVVALMGPSGSGKTTLLNLLAGWESPDSGEIAWDGVPGRELSELRWDELAIVPQRLGLIDELSVRENVELPLRLLRRGPRNGNARVDELLGLLGLAHLASRPPLQTSLGEQQRTALARALVLGPRLLLADEPAGHQDAASAARVLESLRAAAEQGSCCVVATHNRDSLRFCHRALWMIDGRLEGSELIPG